MYKSKKKHILNREISWLSFNERVLQEAQDAEVPLIERIKFLGIFSSNLDEFFSVRVAALKKLLKNKAASIALDYNPKEVLNSVLDIVLSQQNKFESIYQHLLEELEKERIYIIDETEVSPEQVVYIKEYFQEKVLTSMVPIIIDDIKEFPYLKDRKIYLAVRLSDSKGIKKHKHALVPLPTSVLSRFFEIPGSRSNKRYIILLDDVIRFCLAEIFYIFEYDTLEAWTIKLTRDSELQMEDGQGGDLLDKVSDSLKKRKKGIPSRFVYDQGIPKEFLQMITRRMKLRRDDLIPGGRYHNFRDFMKFPNIGRSELSYPPHESLAHKNLKLNQSIIKSIASKDAILHLPYHKYDYVIHYIREAAIDPKVKAIKITLYRIAANSNIINALINAVRNGKQVTAVMELTARFDEESNIYWSEKLIEAGAKVVYGAENLKVHSKMCLVSREEHGKTVHYVNLGTGNYNEMTANLYCDHSLFTSNKKITSEVVRIFDYIEGKKRLPAFKHLIVSPFNPRASFLSLIEKEIHHAKKGHKAHIIIKLNHIVDKILITKLYEASKAGVKIDVIARTTCTMFPLNKNIRIISIVDRFLEHARVYYFHNNGKTKLYLSSSDWMTRNLDQRIEVGFPIYDKNIQQDILRFLEFQLRDNTKARIIDKEQNNEYVRNAKVPVRAQHSIFNYILNE